MLARSQQRLYVRNAADTVRHELGVADVFPPDTEPSLRRLAFSNGVALHQTWQDACQSALGELVERDAVLRSFQGELVPERVAATDSAAISVIDEA